MSHQEKNFEKPEDEMGTISTGFDIPKWLQILVSIFSISLIVVCTICFWKYLEAPQGFASPKELGLSGIFMFSTSALLIVWVPWSKLGVRISKIGGVEFRDIVQGQASEHAEELSYLEDRIEFLEAKIKENDELSVLTDPPREAILRKLLLEFLQKYSEWAFSPSRIRVWGSKQQGFSSLSDYEHPFIRSTLQKLVSEGKLETRVSKKGNTLYRIALP
ncbi:conserved hypothetical protein [Vibrio chagasii]|nr:conserved hypothetical protein [Vibrio chagasii]CAH7296484.1 conserved hypothetical protein [Vibrio chagasii]CAH7420444.1 conserved hypothetical protein [Vibrio chagasii]CAH7450279.1 conserved hypothetical protein [Vibrio chagasii]